MSAPLQRSAAVVALLCLFLLPPCLSIGQTIFYDLVPDMLGMPSSSTVVRAMGVVFRLAFWGLAVAGVIGAAVGVGGHGLAVPLRAVGGSYLLFRTVGMVLGLVYAFGRMAGGAAPAEGDVMMLVRTGVGVLSTLFELGLLGLLVAWLVGGRPLWIGVSAGVFAVLVGLSSVFWTTVSVFDTFTRFGGGYAMDGWIGALYTNDLLRYGSSGLDVCTGFALALVLAGAVALAPREGAAGAR